MESVMCNMRKNNHKVNTANNKQKGTMAKNNYSGWQFWLMILFNAILNQTVYS